jgi:hypothetical protein
MTPEERARERADQERLTRKLKERIAYYEARIAARERGEDPDAATS